jgi:hypothetical protein
MKTWYVYVRRNAGHVFVKSVTAITESEAIRNVMKRNPYIAPGDTETAKLEDYMGIPGGFAPNQLGPAFANAS